MSQSSQLNKVIVGIVALIAMALGVWFGMDGVEETEKHQQTQLTKEAKPKQTELKEVEPKSAEKQGSAPFNQHHVDKVAFLIQSQLEDTNGKELQVADVLAELTLINFWATWCAPCREEMPMFNEVYQQYQSNDFSIVGITIDNLKSTVEFIYELGIQYPILMAEHEGWDLLSKSGNPNNLMPFSLLVDKQGNVLEKRFGLLHKEEIESWIDKYR